MADLPTKEVQDTIDGIYREICRLCDLLGIPKPPRTS